MVRSSNEQNQYTVQCEPVEQVLVRANVESKSHVLDAVVDSSAAQNMLKSADRNNADGQNRHKQNGVAWEMTRWACMHPSCRQNQLYLAALPLFCDRCRKALMQAPQQRIYYQELPDATERAGASMCVRLCNACIGSLRSELKNGCAVAAVDPFLVAIH